jgi:hypothetical protein
MAITTLTAARTGHPSGASSRPGAHAGRLMGVKDVLDALSERDRRPETVADRDLGVVAAVAP